MSDGEFQIPDEVYAGLFKKAIEATKDRDLFPEMTARAREILSNIRKTKEEPMTGIELITEERLDQKIKHNHSIKNDYETRKGGELGMAAQALIEGDATWIPDNMETLKKAISKSYKDRLIIAGALIAAEIDRLNYKE